MIFTILLSGFIWGILLLIFNGSGCELSLGFAFIVVSFGLHRNLSVIFRVFWVIRVKNIFVSIKYSSISLLLSAEYLYLSHPLLSKRQQESTK